MSGLINEGLSTVKSLGTEPSTQRALRWRVSIICLALAAITLAVFGQTLHHEFIDFDDNSYVYENPVVEGGLTLKGVAWAFTGTHAYNWHPLTWLFHMLDCQLYGLKPGGHHLTNVIIHTATVILLFLVLRNMTGALWRSFFVAAVFAIHPLRVESVAWVAECKDVLSGLFFMLTVGAYVRYVRKPWSWWNYLLVLLLFALGLMSKPMLVTMPLILLFLDYWPLQRKESVKRLVLEKLPLLALSAGGCAATLLAQNRVIQSDETYTLALRLSNALVSCMVYLRQMIWPTGLAALYPYPRNGLSHWEVALAIMLLAALSAIALWQCRKQPWLLAGWLWYLVMLVPVIGLVQVGIQAHADRYTYLPQIGIYVALTWLFGEWCVKRHVASAVTGCVMGGVVGTLMVCAWHQTAYWKNSVILWTHALECTTGNELAHGQLGDLLMKQGKMDEALEHYKLAVEAVPNRAESHYNLGSALFRKGDNDGAIAEFQKALDLNTNLAAAHYALGNCFSGEGRMSDAVSQFRQALQIRPDYPEALNNLAWVLAIWPDKSLRDGKKALELAQQANNLTGGTNTIILQTMAAAFAESGNFDDAVKCAQRAIGLTKTTGQQGMEEQLNGALKRYQMGLPYQ